VQYSAEFQRSTKALAEAAKKKNADGASLAYVQLTLTCVNCHKHIKNQRVTDRRLPETNVASNVQNEERSR
jgi:hypothetical protein